MPPERSATRVLRAGDAAATAAGRTWPSTTPTMAHRHSFGELRGLDSTPASSTETGRFGRMFRRLPAVVHDPAVLTALAASMIGEGPENDQKLGVPDDEENFHIPAGYTYLGQFLDHDITFDPVSSLDRQNDPNALTDFRTPRLDLDSLYGRGPADQPFLYDQGDPYPAKLLLGPDGDLQRNAQGRALTGDPRNDENAIVSQLHALFIRFHNRLVDHVRATTTLTKDAVFKEAQRLTRWHYQWMVLHDFLVKVAGREVVDDSLRPEVYQADGQHGHLVKPRLLFYHFREKPFIPVEFSVAAYRFGHSMVRPSYHVNTTEQAAREATTAAPFRIPFFSGDAANSLDGFRPRPAGFTIDWRFFFKLDSSAHLPQPSYKIDTLLSDPLANLVAAGVVPAGEVTSLAERNLLRGLRLGLPSGQAVAVAMGLTPLTPDELALSTRVSVSRDPASPTLAAVLGQEAVDALAENTPLWFYILREAERRSEGDGPSAKPNRLGPVGSRIVAEVFIGLIAGDPLSYLGVAPNWRPDPALANSQGHFGMPELIKFTDQLP